MPFIDRTILDFLLYDWLDAAALTKLPRFSEHSRETFDAVLDLSARVADDHFAPHAKKSDRNEPVFAGETVHVLLEQPGQVALDCHFQPLSHSSGPTSALPKQTDSKSMT